MLLKMRMRNYNSTQQYSSFFSSGWLAQAKRDRDGRFEGERKEAKVAESQVKFYIIWLVDVCECRFSCKHL